MEKLFTHKLRQNLVVLSVLAAGLFMAGHAKASCLARIIYSSSGLTATFSDSGSTALADAHSTTWSFGDSSGATTDNPSHTYSANGTYHVCVTLYDSATACSSSYCQNIYVSNCTLVASYTYSVSGRDVTFNNTTTTTGTTTYVWNFGDGAMDSTSGATVTHTYSDSINNYQTELTVVEHSTTCTASTNVYITLCHASSHYGIQINGHTVQFHGDSTNAGTVSYSWNFGDSSTSTAFSPSHTYSSVGSYRICLTATDSTCSTSACETISISDPTYCIYGRVTKGTGDLGPCMIYLISFNAADSSLTALDSIYVRDSDSYYHFCGLSNGTYYTKAALVSTNPDYSSYIPTYHSNATYWASATPVTISSADATGVDITMTSGTNSGGPGFIGGLISAGANKTGDPEADILVILYNSKMTAVGYTHSDSKGAYGFANLAYGNYSLLVEIPGKTCTPVAIVLDDSHKSVTDNSMKINRQSITESSTTGINTAVAGKDMVQVYPNPVMDQFVINTNLQSAQKITVTVSDVTGKTISVSDRNVAAGDQALSFDASTLHKGMYFVKIQLLKDQKILQTSFVKGQ